MISFRHLLRIIGILFLIIIIPLSSCSNINDENNISSIEQLKSDYPELYQELLKLPDLKDNSIRNSNALEKIASLALSNKNKPVFQKILNEGLKTKRKYCTPLEALLWIAYDRDYDEYNPLKNYNLNSLIQNAWVNTSTSDNFASTRWNNFGEVTDRLNSPDIIAIYLRLRFSYSYKKYEHEGVKSANELFKDRKGACYDHALFACYLLKKNGYENAWGTAVKFDHLVNKFYVGHVGAIYQDPKDSLYYSMDFGKFGYTCYGPFNTIKEAAVKICNVGSNGKAQLKKYKTYDIDIKNGKYIKSSPYF